MLVVSARSEEPQPLACEALSFSPASGAPNGSDAQLLHAINLNPGRRDALCPFFQARMPLGDRKMVLLRLGLYAAGR